MSSPEAAAMFKSERIQPQGPTVVTLRRALARGELAPDTNIEPAMHIIQGPLISRRIVDNSDLTIGRQRRFFSSSIDRASQSGSGIQSVTIQSCTHLAEELCPRSARAVLFLADDE